MKKKNNIVFLSAGILAVILCMFVNRFYEKSLQSCLPVVLYEEEQLQGVWTKDILEKIFPTIALVKEDYVVARREDSFLLSKIKPVELLTMMELENWGMESESLPTEAPMQTSVPKETSLPIETKETMEPFVEEPVREVTATGFVPHSLQTIVDMEQLRDYETLVKNFYIVDSVAMVGSELLDAVELAGVDLRITKMQKGPQILIYHTHSQEGFVDSIPGDDSTTIMGVGEHLAEILRNQYGYEVLHHMGKYDVKSRDSAYSRALPEIEKVLKENPSIQVVIDLHRDAVADESKKLMMELDGRPTARFMFFNGVSCTRKTGNIDYLYNPNLKENLAFSFQMKKVAEEYYPGLTRKNYIHGYRYNMHLCGKTTLIELGAQNNTLQEAMNACDPIAHVLDMVLSGA